MLQNEVNIFNIIFSKFVRYELGNIESGQLVNFKDITYNVDFDMETLRNLEKTKSMYMPLSVSYSNSMSLSDYSTSGQRVLFFNLPVFSFLSRSIDSLFPSVGSAIFTCTCEDSIVFL